MALRETPSERLSTCDNVFSATWTRVWHRILYSAAVISKSKAAYSAAMTPHEAPIEWLVTPCANMMLLVCFSIMCLAALLVVHHGTHGLYGECFWDFAVACHGLYLLRVIIGEDVDANRMHRAMSFFFCNVLFMRMAGICFVADTIYRHRALGLLAAFWRTMLPFVALRKRSCVVILSVMSIVEIATTGFDMWLWDETGILRCAIFLLVLSVASLGWSYAVFFLFYKLYQSQKQVSLEQEACQSILSMVCDATFWLAADGDTLLHRNVHLDTFLGARTKDTQFSSYLSSEEQKRFRHIIDTGSQHVHLLPTTLQNRKTGSWIAVDLFIVNRKHMFAAEVSLQGLCEGDGAPLPSESYGFFVGLRFSAGMEHTMTSGGPLLEAASTTELTVVAPSKPNKLRSEGTRSSGSSETSILVLGNLPNVDTVSVEMDPLRTGMGITRVTYNLSDTAGGANTFEKWLLQPSYNVFHGWITEQVNSVCAGREMPCPHLGPVLISVPPLSTNKRGSKLSASQARLEEVDPDDLGPDCYPLVTLVLEGVQEVMTSNGQRDVAALPAISELRHRASANDKNISLQAVP